MAKDFFSLKQVQSTPGSIIRAFRKNFGLTLKDLEKITGIDEANLSAIENNKREVGLKSAILLAAVFGIDPGQILFPDGFERKVLYAKVRGVVKQAERFVKMKKTHAGSSRVG